jgi:hypothetical protein
MHAESRNKPALSDMINGLGHEDQGTRVNRGQ